MAVKQYPLKHRMGFHFNLQEFETTHQHQATILPLYFADQTKTDVLAEAVQVNPGNDTFEGIIQDPACFMNSRVNKIRIQEYCMISTAADIPDNLYMKSLITFGLGDADVRAVDDSTLIAAMAMTKGSDTLLPTFNTFKLEHANLMPASIDTLITTQILEGSTLSPDALYNNRFGELGAKVRAISTKPQFSRVHKDYPYYADRWYNTPPKARRMGAFVGCYLWVAMNTALADGATAVASDHLAIHFDDDLTIDEESINFHYAVEFNEFNEAFDQAG